MKTAVLYSSKYGTSAFCASQLASNLSCDLFSLDEMKTIDISDYDQVILGTSVYMGKIRKAMTHFVDLHQEVLKEKSVSLFFCCNGSTDYKALVPTQISHAKVHHLGFELKMSKMRFF
jgi:menaquinone-dependent protoporphyrinogen oxidase